MHEELYSTLEKAILNGIPDSIVRAAPRGNAKSTIVSLLLVLWCALYEYKKYILIVSDTAGQANDLLASVKTELEDNELLMNDFGVQQGVIWTSSDIILRNDIRIQALGTGKKVRGRRYKQYRPDLIIGDDLENDENVVSPDQRKKDKVWFKKALSKAGDERTDKIIIGTILHYDSLLSDLLKNPIYDTAKYKSIIAWSASPLWEEWERIITNLDDADRLKNARKFYEDREAEMLHGTVVLWPQKESYYDLMIQRIVDGPAAFSSEKQNEPIDDDERRFSPDWIRYYDDSELIGQDLYVVAYIDPSMGKAGGDDSAIIVLGMSPSGQTYCLAASIGKRHPDLIIEDAISLHMLHRFSILGVEEVAFQEFFKDSVRKRLEEIEREDKKLALILRGIRVHSDKILRIQSLQPDIKTGRIKFKRDQQKLIEQLVNFPSAAHDDGPDALHGAMKLFGKRMALVEFYKEKAHESQRPNLQILSQSIQ